MPRRARLADSWAPTRHSTHPRGCFSPNGNFAWRYVLSLLRFPAARKASAQGADLTRVRQKLTLLFILLFLVPNFSGESTPLLRKRVSEVRLALVATDQNNRPLPDLSPTDITVFDDGRPVSNFELRSAGDLPLRLGIVLDLSDSTQRSWGTVRNALINSLQQVIRPKDQLLVLTFSSEIALQRTLTEPAQLDATLQNPAAGGLTALYDSIYRTCDDGLFNADAEPHRSAVILFSDGEDNLSRHSLNEPIAKA